MMVEANKHHRESWRRAGLYADARVRGTFAVLSDKEGDVAWHTTSSVTRSGDSLFAEATAYHRGSISRRAEPLDKVMARTFPGHGAVELIK